MPTTQDGMNPVDIGLSWKIQLEKSFYINKRFLPWQYLAYILLIAWTIASRLADFISLFYKKNTCSSYTLQFLFLTALLYTWSMQRPTIAWNYKKIMNWTYEVQGVQDSIQLCQSTHKFCK